MLNASNPWVIDPAGFGLSSLAGREIAGEDATPKGFDGIKRMPLGEFKNAHQRLCRISGLMASATALAAMRTADTPADSEEEAEETDEN